MRTAVRHDFTPLRQHRSRDRVISREGIEEREALPAPGAIHRYLGAQKQDLDMRRQPVNTSPIVTRLIGGVAILLTPIRH